MDLQLGVQSQQSLFYRRKKMSEIIKANYYYQFTRKSSGEILLEGFCDGGSKADCQKMAQNIALQNGLKPMLDEDIKTYLRPATTEEKEMLKVKPIKDLMSRYGLNIKKLSERFCIPYRTVQNWVGGQRECPSYLIKMMDEILSKEK